MICPRCHSINVVKNGSIHNGKPKFACKDCDRQFVENPENRIPQDKKDLIDKLLLERIPLAGIARVVGVSERWLQGYVNRKYQEVPQHVDVKKKPKGPLVIQGDELWSFVGNKNNKQWVWLAIDQGAGEIVGVFVGDRSHQGAQGLWDSLPPVYRQCAVCYTDFWESYSIIFPSTRHKAVGKESGHTYKIERFNGTLRQRVSRLVRKTLSFSKKIENHVGAIWYFIHHYNRTLPIAAV